MILMVGPDYTRVNGGMSTVVKNYYESDLIDKIDIKFIATYNEGNIIYKLLFAIQAYIKILLELAFNRKIKIIHINMAARGSFYRKSIVVLLSKLFRKKTIIHMHGGAFSVFYEQECNNITKKYINFIFNISNIILVLSNEWKERFERYNIYTKIKVLYNGVKVPLVNNYNEKNNNIIFLGKICEEKGIFDLLLVIKQLREKNNDIKLIIGGEGEVERLSSEIKKLGIEENVNYLGWINTDERNYWLKKSKIFILPSYYEAMPMSILEAMSFGIPVISTQVGGIPTLINNNVDGILYTPGNLEELRNSILKLYSDDNLLKKISNNCYKKCKNKFSLDKINNEILKIYHEVNKLRKE